MTDARTEYLAVADPPSGPTGSVEPADDAADAPARTGRPRDDAREQAIVEAALQLVAEVGYDRLTIDGVAARARASKATIYRRWPGKAELIVDALHRRAPQPVEIPDLGSLRAELVVGLRLLTRHIAGLDGSLLCGIAGACHDDDDLAACFNRMIELKDSPLRAVVTRAVARGEAPSGAGDEVLDEVLSAVCLVRAMRRLPLDDEFVDVLVTDVAIPILTTPPTRKEYR